MHAARAIVASMSWSFSEEPFGVSKKSLINIRSLLQAAGTHDYVSLGLEASQGLQAGMAARFRYACHAVCACLKCFLMCKCIGLLYSHLVQEQQGRFHGQSSHWEYKIFSGQLQMRIASAKTLNAAQSVLRTNLGYAMQVAFLSRDCTLRCVGLHNGQCAENACSSCT